MKRKNKKVKRLQDNWTRLGTFFFSNFIAYLVENCFV